MIISIGGSEGSGKSSLAKRLALKLGWPRYYMGGMRREAAGKRGLTLAEYNKLGETDPATDLEVDKYQEELGKTRDNFVIEGRTSWYFVPHSVKIYLLVDDKVAAKRVFADLQENNHRNEDDQLNTEADVLASIYKRRQCDNLRYAKYFNINVHDRSNFDFILDTTNLGKEEAFAEVCRFLREEKGLDI